MASFNTWFHLFRVSVGSHLAKFCSRVKKYLLSSNNHEVVIAKANLIVKLNSN